MSSRAALFFWRSIERCSGVSFVFPPRLSWYVFSALRVSDVSPPRDTPEKVQSCSSVQVSYGVLSITVSLSCGFQQLSFQLRFQLWPFGLQARSSGSRAETKIRSRVVYNPSSFVPRAVCSCRVPLLSLVSCRDAPRVLRALSCESPCFSPPCLRGLTRQFSLSC